MFEWGGYWQVEMEEDSKAFTAFTVRPLGFYECECMPFGLTNAPSTFQWLMQSCLGNLHLHYCIIYLDDIIVFSKTLEEHLLRLRAVFKKLNQVRLKLKPFKCELVRQELIYLGHVVSRNGIQTDPKKVEAIHKWPVLTNVTEVRSFLGFTNNYWRFIKKYAQVAKPLHKLISGENVSKKWNSIKWDLECQHAFDNLKELCITTPILAYADFAKPFKLHTDTSVLGLCAVLCQVHDGVEKVISYASRSLTKSETKYPAHKLEFLCLKWAITEQFHEYLYGNTFDVYTNNNPLTYVLKTDKLNAMEHRWITGLANYNFHIHYQSGKSNVKADALSRINWKKDDQTLQADSIQANVTAVLTGQGDDYIETIPCSPQIIDSLIPSIHDNAQVVCKSITTSGIKSNSDCSSHPDPSWNPKCMIMLDWVKAQAEDPVIGDLIQWYQARELHKGKDIDSPEMKQFLKQRGKLLLRNGILYCKNDTQKTECPDRNTMQLILPTTF